MREKTPDNPPKYQIIDKIPKEDLEPIADRKLLKKIKDERIKLNKEVLD